MIKKYPWLFLIFLSLPAFSHAQGLAQKNKTSVSPSDKFGATEEPSAPTVTPTPPTVTTTTTTVTSPVASIPTDPTVPLSPSASGVPLGVTASPDDQIYLNATDADITEIIKQISKATGTNFLIDDKVKGKITIISEKPLSKEMAYQAFLSALEVMGYTTVATPSGLVKIVQTKEAISKPIDIFKEDSPYTDRYITRILQMRNISANEISSVIKSLVSKDGNMFAYPATNSLIITDTGSNIDRILKIIRELDQEGPQEVIEIIPIQYADAVDITDKILQLFEQDSGAKAPAKTAAARRTLKSADSELQDVPQISKVITDERTNSIIILGSKHAIIRVKSLINQLDTAVSGAEGAIHVYYMKYANAKEMADVLNSLTGSGSSSKTKKTTSKTSAAADDKPAASAGVGSVELEGGVKVTADEGTNSLVITASPKDYQTLIDRVIAKLDIPRRQVYLEGVILELTVEKLKTFGFSGNFGSLFKLFGQDLTGFGSVLPLSTTALSSIAQASGGLAGGVFSKSTVDFNLADGSSVSIPAISAIVNALQSDSDVNVLSTPSILTLDNQEAQIQVGEEVPVPSGSTVSSGVTTFNVTREDTGIIMKITPQISESDSVRLKLSQEVSNVQPNADPNLGPTLTKRAVDTVVVANNQQTVVIGGLIQDSTTVGINKVPLLGDVPVLGYLFKNKATQKSKTNILIFVTPYIIKEKKDYLAILQRKMEERDLFIENNFGPGQRKLIRKSLEDHAQQLLSYKGMVPTAGTMVPNPDQQTTMSTPSTPSTGSTTNPYEPEKKVKYKGR